MNPDTLFSGLRILAAGIDLHGDLLVRDGRIHDFGQALGRPDSATLIEAEGAILCPGLIDMRAALGEPGFEYRETIASAALAAAAGGITTLAALPDTNPAIDDPALVQLLRTKGEQTGSLTILPYGAVTSGCRGEELAEIGLLHEAGAVAFTDGTRTIGPARLMRLALSYAKGFGARIVQHPEDPSLPAAPQPKPSSPPASACPASPPPPKPSSSPATSASPNSPAAPSISPMSPPPRPWR
jgi:dihydroorotase